jgi:hypothetical protein
MVIREILVPGDRIATQARSRPPLASQRPTPPDTAVTKTWIRLTARPSLGLSPVIG